ASGRCRWLAYGSGTIDHGRRRLIGKFPAGLPPRAESGVLSRIPDRAPRRTVCAGQLRRQPVAAAEHFAQYQSVPEPVPAFAHAPERARREPLLRRHHRPHQRVEPIHHNRQSVVETPPSIYRRDPIELAVWPFRLSLTATRSQQADVRRTLLRRLLYE